MDWLHKWEGALVKWMIVDIPPLADNLVAMKLGLHPLQDVPWQHLGGSLYVIYLQANQESMFRQRLRRLRFLCFSGIFDRIILKEFDTWDEMNSFVGSTFPWIEMVDKNPSTE